MILADTSVWIDHLRHNNPDLAERLEAKEILSHPFVVGELALGHLNPRDVILRDLTRLPQSVIASNDEVLNFISEERLFGQGIGYVDAHLLASTRLTGGAVFWTRDSRLHRVAQRLKLATR